MDIQETEKYPFHCFFKVSISDVTVYIQLNPFKLDPPPPSGQYTRFSIKGISAGVNYLGIRRNGTACHVLYKRYPVKRDSGIVGDRYRWSPIKRDSGIVWGPVKRDYGKYGVR